MINAFLTIVLAFFVVAVAINSPSGLAYLKSASPRQKKLALAWIAMFVGQAQLFSHSSAFQGVEGAHLYQMAWMFVAAVLIFQLVISAKILSGTWRFPVIALFIYCIFAIASVAFSPSKGLSLYKSAQVIMDALLVVVSCSELIRSRSPAFILDITMVLVSFLLLSVVVGALVAPELAFAINEGAVGKSLHGVVPTIHQNELGLMAAIGLVVGLRRMSGISLKRKEKFFWMTMAILSGGVLFLAQARTSLAGGAVALILAGLLIKRLRWIAIGVFVGAVGVSIFYMLSGAMLGIEDTVKLYITRGVSDEHMANLSGRTGLWQIGWEMFKDSPLFGHGYAAGVRMFGPLYGLPLGTNMHSSHMQVLVDMGAIGYLVWLSFVLGVAYLVYRNFSVTKRPSVEGDLAVEAGLVVFMILFRSFLGHVLVTHQFNMMIFLSVYIFAAVSLTARKFSHGQEALPVEKENERLISGQRNAGRLLVRK